MATLLQLKAIFAAAEKKRDAATHRLEDSDHEADTLTKGIESLVVEEAALAKRDAGGEDVEAALADNSGFIHEGQDRLAYLEKRRPYLRDVINEAEAALDAAKHLLALEEAKRIRNTVLNRWDALHEAEGRFLALWHAQRAEVDDYKQKGGGDIGFEMTSDALLYRTLTHEPADDEAFKLVATTRTKQSIERAGTVIPQPTQQFNRSAAYLRDGAWLKIRVPAEVPEQQETDAA
jgi:hypothetical protein